MSPEDLERLLRRWGAEFGPRPSSEWDEDSSGTAGGLTSSLLQMMRVGIGAQAGVPLKKPSWINPETGAVCPMYIAGVVKLTARGKASRGGQRQWNPTIDGERVERAALDLYAFNRLRGVALRMEYCLRGYRQKEKAIFTGQTEGIGERITLRRYRHELDLARQFMAGKLFSIRAAA